MIINQQPPSAGGGTSSTPTHAIVFSTGFESRGLYWLDDRGGGQTALDPDTPYFFEEGSEVKVTLPYAVREGVYESIDFKIALTGEQISPKIKGYYHPYQEWRGYTFTMPNMDMRVTATPKTT